MRVVDLIKSTDNTAFSFEILPPLKGTGIEKLYKTVDTLREFDPKYINITTHRSEYVYKELGNGLYQRTRQRRRPGTVAVAAALQNKYNITTVPHILCSGFSREDTEYVLLDLQFLGITDLLVLRGDKAKHESAFVPENNGYNHAIELEEQINDFNKGVFVDGSPIKVTEWSRHLPRRAMRFQSSTRRTRSTGIRSLRHQRYGCAMCRYLSFLPISSPLCLCFLCFLRFLY